MLVLTRKLGEKIVINDNVTLVVQRISGNRVSLGIEAPQEVSVQRGELRERASAVEDRPLEPVSKSVAGRIGFSASSRRLVAPLRRVAR